MQAFPLPPAEHHMSTTVMTPAHGGVAAMFDLLGRTIPVDDYGQCVCVPQTNEAVVCRTRQRSFVAVSG